MDIRRVLSDSPREIALKAHEAEEARCKWEEGKVWLKKKEAEKALNVKALDCDATVAQIKAEVDNDELIYKYRLEVLIQESEYRKKVIDLEKWGNAYISARKIASLQLEVDKHTV